ncbi:hypothetical protein BY458DRAFT_515160 [Sporodiniella umbellata]|nr:hypothetical protein BY458DRAFT_515160 [Sporodiniella umbellata]
MLMHKDYTLPYLPLFLFVFIFYVIVFLFCLSLLLLLLFFFERSFGKIMNSCVENPRLLWQKYASGDNLSATTTEQDIFEMYIHLKSREIARLLPQTFMCDLSLIRTLDLSDNRIEEIPKEMPLCLPALESLKIEGNRIRTLPKTITRCKNLKVLTLGESYQGNPLGSVPTWLREMSSLKVVKLDSCQINHLEPGTLGPWVEHVTLAHNGLSCLDLAAFGNALCHLDLKSNRISLIKTQAEPLTHLTVLKLSNNLVQEIPKDLPQKLPALVTLFLNCNTLCYLPLTVRWWKRMKKLVLENNPLRALPSSLVEMESLEDLLVSNCLIDRLDGFGPHLQSVDLSFNRIERLESACFHRGLLHLDVSNNLLQTLTSAPFLDCHRLESLDVSNNLLRDLSDCFVKKVVELMNGSLGCLSLNDNKLLTVPWEFLSCNRSCVVYTMNNPLFLSKTEDEREKETPRSRYHQTVSQALFRPLPASKVLQSARCYSRQDSGTLDLFLDFSDSNQANAAHALKCSTYHVLSLREIAARDLATSGMAPCLTLPHYQQMIEPSMLCFVCQKPFYEEWVVFLHYKEYTYHHALCKAKACSYRCWKKSFNQLEDPTLTRPT